MDEVDPREEVVATEGADEVVIAVAEVAMAAPEVQEDEGATMIITILDVTVMALRLLIHATLTTILMGHLPLEGAAAAAEEEGLDLSAVVVVPRQRIRISTALEVEEDTIHPTDRALEVSSTTWLFVSRLR